MPVTFLAKTVQYKTLCFRWNCTNSKFKRPCFSSCQCCGHTRMILTVLYTAWTSAKLITGWRSRLSHTSTFSPLLPHSWSSHKSSMLKMPHVASTLSADEKERSRHPSYYIADLVLIQGIMLYKFGRWCTNFTFHKNCMSCRWVTQTSKNNNMFLPCTPTKTSTTLKT